MFRLVNSHFKSNKYYLKHVGGMCVCVYIYIYIYIYIHICIYRVSQEERTKLRESVPYVKL